MTYGVYSKDLKGCALTGVSLSDAKSLCYGDRVVCSEKQYVHGFSITIVFDKWWEWRIRPRSGHAHIGFVHIAWHKCKHTWADKIVYDPKNEEGEK